MVRVATPCPRCRAIDCRCGYRTQQAQERRRRQRLVRPYDHAERTLHAAIIARHVERYGWLCPDCPELGHAPHAVRPGQLDVDDIVPVNAGGDRRDPRNKRVLCRKVNRGRRA